MRPVSTTLGNYVLAPVERVFDLLTDPTRFPDWLPGCSSAEPAGQVKKGSKLNVRFGTRHTNMLSGSASEFFSSHCEES